MLLDPAPGRPAGRAGVVVSPMLAILLLLAGCDALPGGETIELDDGQVSVSGSVHDVEIAGAGAADSIAPSTIEAEPGDAIRFVTADRRPHAIAFTQPSLSGPVREYLDGSGQLRGPPLVNQGAAWVVVLDEAPPGRYPFHCRSHDADGEVIVTGED